MRISVIIEMSTKRLYPPEYLRITEKFKLFKNHSHYRGLICAICRDILVEPRQLICGCRFCHSCIKAHVKECVKYCPGCQDVVESIQKNIIHDVAAEKELFELSMKCINQDCDYVCKLRDLVDHLKKCEQREKECKLCSELYLYSKKEEHKTVNCKMIIIKCKDCGMEMSKKNHDEIHKDINNNLDLLCDDWSAVCPMKCSEEVYDNLKIHLQNCPNVLVECEMKDAGCTKKIPRKDMMDHMRIDSWNHSSLMVVLLMRMKTENKDLKLKCLEYDKRLTTEISHLHREIETSVAHINILKNKIILCERNSSLLENEANILKQSLNFFPSSKTILKSPQSYGEFTWTITKIHHVIADAKRGINVQIFSDPFYSGRPGYQMCLKMYPNGDGTGYGLYMSLFFVIMKGEHDDVLKWPFCQKVSLKLLSNKSVTDNCTINMKPDRNEACYGKPTKQFNLAAGQPQFISHKELMNENGFIKNDTIVIQALVS